LGPLLRLRVRQTGGNHGYLETGPLLSRAWVAVGAGLALRALNRLLLALALGLFLLRLLLLRRLLLGRLAGALIAAALRGLRLLGRLLLRGLLPHPPRLLRLGGGGADALAQDHAADEIAEERLPVPGVPAQLAARVEVARHGIRPRRTRGLLLERRRLRGGCLGRPVVELHAQGEPHLRQDLLDLLQRLAAEVLGLEHAGFRLLHQVADGLDVGVLQAVGGAQRSLELVDRSEVV